MENAYLLKFLRKTQNSLKICFFSYGRIKTNYLTWNVFARLCFYSYKTHVFVSIHVSNVYYLMYGCILYSLFYFFSISGFTDRIACSHMRVLDLFTESISSHCSFLSHPCANKNDFAAGKCHSCGSGCPAMGYHSDKTHPHGKFYLSTHASSPFCV